MFVGLQCSMLNYWTHATLVAMMKGDDVDEQKGTSCMILRQVHFQTTMLQSFVRVYIFTYATKNFVLLKIKQLYETAEGTKFLRYLEISCLLFQLWISFNSENHPI